jgi:dipeptidyl aminopeptidase/acylaminoacyl peptidase
MNRTILVFLHITLCVTMLCAQTAPKKNIGNLTTDQVPDLPADLQERWEQYQNVRSTTFADWDSKGEGIYISTQLGEVAQIHHVAKAGAYREQLTFAKEPLTSASTCPNPARSGFLYSKDLGGNENYQIYFFDNQSFKHQLLTDGKSRNGGAKWNAKGDKIAFSSNKRSAGSLDFYIKTLDGGAPELILENKGGGWSIVDWSADESKMLIINYLSINDSKLYVFDLANKKLEPINTSTTQIAYKRAQFAKNGNGVYLLSDENTEFMGLRFYDLKGKTMSKIADLNWDIEDFELSKDEKTLVFTTNEGGYYKINILDTRSLKYKSVPKLPNGVISNMTLHKNGKLLAFTLTTPTTTKDVYVLHLEKNNVERWTFSENGGLPANGFVDAVLRQFPTFDKDERTGEQRKIPVLVYMPKNYTGKVPVVIQIHGGPEGQSFPDFNAWRQFLANELGVAVLVPNVRGSSGYGKTFVKLDNGVLREHSVKDIGALLDWAATQSVLDSTRMAVMGQSYGGYMSLASMTHFNNRFKCGIDLYGISNFVSFLKNTSSYRADLRRVEYGDEREPKMQEFLQKISPLTHIKQITKPMFIFQGANDPRVPLSESEQMVAALRENGVSTWYIMAKDEGHGIYKRTNRDYVFASIALFLKQNLLK